jgi:ABC-type bacteriocin/lantibiotic exporter with double-glycine peptidase domain
MNNDREQQNSMSEQGSRDAMPPQYGIKGKLLQFRQPMHNYLTQEAKLPPGHAPGPLPRNESETGKVEQPAGVLYDPNARQAVQASSQISYTSNTGQAAQVPYRAPSSAKGAGNAQWQDQVRGGFVPPTTNDAHANAAPVQAPMQVSVQMPKQVSAPVVQSGRAVVKEEEEFEDPFAAPRSPFLGLLAWPFRALGALFRPRRSMPELTQMAATECGAASLAMILSYYGHHVSISEVSTQCGVGRDGLSASSIVKSARQYGLKARAISVHDIDRFVELDLPAIIHWKFNHFMVVERWTPKLVHVVDPALGRKKLTRDEFNKGFTGIVVLLEPDEQFTRRRGASSSALLANYLQNALKLAPGAMFQILFASLILLLFGLVMPGTTAIIINSIVPLSLLDMLPVFGLSMFLLVLSHIVLNYVRSVILIKLEARIDTHLMISFFDHLLSLPLRYFQLRSSGDILNRMESNTVLRDTLNTQLISSILDTISVVVYLAILIKLSPVFAAMAVFFGITQVILMVSVNRQILKLLKGGLESQGKAQSYLTEALVQISTLKAAGAEKHVRLRWLRLFFANMSTVIKGNYFITFIVSLQSIIRSLAPLTLLLIGAQQVIVGSLQLGTMMALLSLATAFLGPLESLVATGQQIQQAYAHLERIVDVMKAEPEQHGRVLHQPPRLTGHIQLVNVGFQYDLNAQPVLRNINLTIQPGQKVALVGRSGAGKSTLGKLLLGLYLPTQGEIYYDTLPLSSMNHQEVRAQFGVVMQDVGLFNGSIRENIAFNTPGVDLTAVIWAAQNASIHEDIIKMPMDYETIVSEGGSAISGGQRQRLALARALVRDPAILLLDEATSSLDVATERVVEQNLHRLSCTQIIIAHRLSTIRNADIILAVDQGTIVEQGTHDELLKHNGFYARLIESQVANGDIKGNS